MKRLVFLATAFLMLGAAAACGGDDTNTQIEGRTRAIGTLSENVSDGWAANGPQAIYNALHRRIMDQCAREDYLSIMEGEPQPTAWRNTKDIAISDDLNQATATVIVVIDGQDIEQEWRFEVETARWRVTDAPGVAECVGG